MNEREDGNHFACIINTPGNGQPHTSPIQQFKIFTPIGRYFQNCHGRPSSDSSFFLSPGQRSVDPSSPRNPKSWNNSLIDMVETQVALGLSVPACTPHAVSVSLPTWGDNVGYEEGEKRVVDKMISGYPRFFIHLSIQKVSPNFLDLNLSLTAKPYNSWQRSVNKSILSVTRNVCSSRHKPLQSSVARSFSRDPPPSEPQ